MARSVSFLTPGAWAGGSWELAVDLGRRSRRAATATVRWIWSRNEFDGPYATNQMAAEDQVRVISDRSHGEHLSQLYGLVDVPTFGRLVCSTTVFREPDEDWLLLGIPIGALGILDDRVGGYPFDADPDDEPEWALPIDNWMAAVALDLMEVIPFRRANIGFIAGDLGTSTVYVDADGYHRDAS